MTLVGTGMPSPLPSGAPAAAGLARRERAHRPDVATGLGQLGHSLMLTGTAATRDFPVTLYE